MLKGIKPTTVNQSTWPHSSAAYNCPIPPGPSVLCDCWGSAGDWRNFFTVLAVSTRLSVALSALINWSQAMSGSVGSTSFHSRPTTNTNKAGASLASLGQSIQPWSNKMEPSSSCPPIGLPFLSGRHSINGHTIWVGLKQTIGLEAKRLWDGGIGHFPGGRQADVRTSRCQGRRCRDVWFQEEVMARPPARLNVF